MKKSGFLLIFLLAVAGNSFAAQPDTLAIADVSHDTVDQTPAGWTNILPEKAKVYTNYTVRYDDSGPYINASANSAGSWIERDMGDFDISRYPILEWEWKVVRFPNVQWEQRHGQDDFALRVELVYDYRGSKWNILNLFRKGLITTLFRGNPPVLVMSYVWSVEVPVDQSYPSPGSDRVTVHPIESGAYITNRWMHERRNIREDLTRLLAGESNVALRKIRIRCDTDDSGSSAESGIRNIRLITGKYYSGPDTQ